MMLSTMSIAPVEFSFPANAVYAFTKGDCWVLAQELEAAYGYPIIMATYGDGYWCHAANMLPDGRIVDIEGIRSEDDWVKRWTTPISFNLAGGESIVPSRWSAMDLRQEIMSIRMTHRHVEFSSNVSFYASQIERLVDAQDI